MNHRDQIWKRPPSNVVKINVDATIFKDQGIYGAGMVLRDDKGSFLKAKSITTQGIPGMKKEKA